MIKPVISLICYTLICVYGVSAYAEWSIARTTAYSHPVNIAQFEDYSFGVTAGFAGEIRFSADGGQTWPVYQKGAACLFGLGILDTKNVWFCGNRKLVYTSHDKGKSLKKLPDYGANEPDHCRHISFCDPLHGWIAGPTSLSTTKDGGNTWTAITPPCKETIVAIFMRTVSEGYVLSSSGILFNTRNGGTSWTSIPLGVSDRMEQDMISDDYYAPRAAINFRDDRNGIVLFFAVTPGDKWISMRTDDGGKTWKSDPLPEIVSEINGPVAISRDAKLITLTDKTRKKIYLISDGRTTGN